jgi:signal transduction histidine kinase
VSFRSRLLAAFAAATLLPIALLAIGVRRQIVARLTAQHERRVEGMARVTVEDLARERASIDTRLHSLVTRLGDDNRLRLALLANSSRDRDYLLDWASEAMHVNGLSMLELQNDEGRILSSGHFRNEFDRLEPALPRLLAAPPDSIALVAARNPEGRFLVLAGVDSVQLGGRRFTLVGGITVDRALLSRFAHGDGLTITLLTPDDTLSTGTAPDDSLSVAAERRLLYVDARGGDSTRVASARLVVLESRADLDALLHDVRSWFLFALVIATFGALSLAAWLAVGLSRPVAALAQAASTIDLDGPDVRLAIDRDDEVGALARRFNAMMRRLRASAARLRDAERRATVGEMARQVNHDIKNGLIPIRNVMRHLVEVQEQRPGELPAVFAERRGTIESSIGYLDTLARNYARLTPRNESRAFDANAVVREVASSSNDGSSVETQLADDIPQVLGDPVFFRRIVDNLLRNALESLPTSGGRVRLSTARTARGAVRLEIADTGRGMTEQELDRAFDDFFTTKPDGTGLGLSVVRRLVSDLHGVLRVTSELGRGTTFIIELPSTSGAPGESSDTEPSGRRRSTSSTPPAKRDE